MCMWYRWMSWQTPKRDHIPCDRCSSLSLRSGVFTHLIHHQTIYKIPSSETGSCIFRSMLLSSIVRTLEAQHIVFVRRALMTTFLCTVRGWKWLRLGFCAVSSLFVDDFRPATTNHSSSSQSSSSSRCGGDGPFRRLLSTDPNNTVQSQYFPRFRSFNIPVRKKCS